MEQTVQLVTALIGIISAVCIRLMSDQPVIRTGVMLVFACGLFSVSWLAVKGTLVIGSFEVSATNIATFNRAFIAAVLSATAVKMYARRWGSRHVRGERET